VTRPNGSGDNCHLDAVQEPANVQVLNELPIENSTPASGLATRAKQRTRQEIQPNRFVIIGAGALLAGLVIFLAISMPHRKPSVKTKNKIGVVAGQPTVDDDSVRDRSLFPIIDFGRSPAPDPHDGFLSESDLQKTITRSAPRIPQTGQSNGAGTLGSIPPFGDQAWQAPPYQSETPARGADMDKVEREAMEKSALAYVSKTSPKLAPDPTPANDAGPEFESGLATGTRLRARLESPASTAVRTPVIAVIEYNYELNSEIVVPAGAKAVGHIRSANRSGYVDIQFDSLLIPGGMSIPIEAAATDLDLRPLKGRVEGKNTGRNMVVRSLSGIGQAGSMLLGQSSLGQPLSQSDLIRGRISNNIGEAADQEVTRLAQTERIVVTVSAGVPIYVVFEQTRKAHQGSTPAMGKISAGASSANLEQLRQLLQLEEERNRPASNPSPQ
jgi:hypothetical protein